MATVYMSSFLYSEELSVSNFLGSLESHSNGLSRLTSTFRDLISYIRSENINIEEVNGVPFGGSFNVSEEDAQKLIAVGLVADCSNITPVEYKEPENIPIFYIDTRLDELIGNRDMDFGLPTVSISFPNFSIQESKETSPTSLGLDHQVLIDLGKMLKEFPTGSSYINIDTESIEEDKWTFNIGISDVGYDVMDVDFDRQGCSFTFMCGACSDPHKSDLKSVYTSLSTVISLLSNIVAYSPNKEFVVAFDYIVMDLRLLKTLLEVDYAVGS